MGRNSAFPQRNRERSVVDERLHELVFQPATVTFVVRKHTAMVIDQTFLQHSYEWDIPSIRVVSFFAWSEIVRVVLVPPLGFDSKESRVLELET